MRGFRSVSRCSAFLLVPLYLILTANFLAEAQQQPAKKPAEPGPMLSQGTIELDTPDFHLSLVRSSQTVAALKVKNTDGFDFTPGDLLVARSQNGFMHLGDITLRLRTG